MDDRRVGALARAFVDGAVRPSPVAVGVMLATMTLLTAMCCVVVTPDAIAGGMWRLLARTGDDAAWLQATARWLDLRRSPPRTPALLVVGSSAIEEGLRPHLLARELEQRLGYRPDLRPLLMRGLGCWEIAALVDLLPPSSGGVIALGVGLGVLAPQPGLRAGVLLPVGPFERELRQRFGARVAEPTGVYFLDRFRVLAPRMPHVVRELVAPSPQRPRAGFRRFEERVADGSLEIGGGAELAAAGGPGANLATGVAVLTEVVRRLARRDRLTVVLVDQPLDRDRAGRWLAPGVLPAYRAAIARVAADAGVEVLRPDGEAALRSRDFLDLSHLDPAGSGPERFTSALAHELASLLPAAHGAAQ